MDYSVIISAVVLSTFLVVLFEYFRKKRKDPEYVHPIDRMWRGGSLNVWILAVGAVAALVLLVRGVAELDPETNAEVPPPPPPVDVILNKPTFIGFVPDSLQLDSAMNALGEENFYIGIDDHAWYTHQLLEKTLAADVPVIWEYGAALSYLIPGDVDDRRLIKDPSELFQYFYFDGDSLFETNIFLEGTPLENYEVHRDSIDIDPAVYSAIPGAGDENNRQQWWVDDCRNCLKLSDTLELDMNDNGVSEYIFFDLGYCTSLVIREEGAEDIRIGCNIPQQNDLPETVDWVNMWYPVTEREVHETTFDNDEGLGEGKVKLDNYGFFIGKEEAGGGVIGYVNGELVYLYQGC